MKAPLNHETQRTTPAVTNAPDDLRQRHTHGISKRRAFWRTLALLSIALLHQKVVADVDPVTSSHQSQSHSKALGPTTPTPATETNGNVVTEEAVAQAVQQQKDQFPVLNHHDNNVNSLDPRYHNMPISAPTARPGRHQQDILIVSAVDGSLAGVSLATGKVIWKRPGGASTDKSNQQSSEAAPSLLQPLVSTSTTIQSSSKVRAEDDWRTTAVPSIDGSIHLTARTSAASHNDENESGKVTLTTSILELTKRAPFVDNRGRVYSAQQRSTTFAIDGETGEILQQIPNTSSSGWSQQNNQSTWKDRLVVWIGRMDRSITIHEPRSGELDVEVGAAQILSINDMVVARAPGEESSTTSTTSGMSGTQRSPLLLEGSTISSVDGSLVATPSGHLAWRDNESGQIAWISNERFGSPVAYAVDARSGNSLKVNMIPDAPVPLGSPEYLSKELQRQYELATSENDDFDDLSGSTLSEEHTIVGALPNGQLYALPLLGRRNNLGLHQSNLGHHQTLAASAAASAETRVSTSVPTGGTTLGHHHSSYQHAAVEKKGSKPLLKRNCQPGNSYFPACLVRGRQERLEDFASVGPGSVFSEAAFYYDGEEENSAVVPFSKFQYEHFASYQQHHYNNNNNNEEERNRRKLQRGLRLLGSWLAPVIALIFVLSFEMGRRKRQQEKDKLQTEIMDVSTVKPVPSNQSEGGVIQVYDDIILGYGGHGTVVFKGLLDGRQVAVKRMLKAYHGSADREISLLIESDGHPNVVRYFLKEVRGDFVYLALELCDLSLHELIGQIRGLSEAALANKESLFAAVPDATKGILLQIAQGVKHLHGLRIVHRDLKPANILLADSRKSKRKVASEGNGVCDMFVKGQYVAKISDMGLGKQIVGQSSFGGVSTFGEASFRGQSNGGQSSIAGAGPGSVGWQAPEVMALRMPSDVSTRSDDSSFPITDSLPEGSPMDIAAHARTSRSVDIFSLGCIFYATLVPGSHPFGEWYEREANIMHNRPNMEILEAQSPDAYNLVSSMIQRLPTDRPTAKQICEHPFFWSADRRLSFLCDVSDRIESEGTTTDGSLPKSFVTKLLAIERRASEVVGIAWDSVLDEELVNNVQRFRTYDPSSVRDLLRLIRNKHHHFDELPEVLKAEMGSNSAGLLRYFESRFPRLLIHCFTACRSFLLPDDALALKYSIVPLSKKMGRPSEPAVPSIPEVPPALTMEAATDSSKERRQESREEKPRAEGAESGRDDEIGISLGGCDDVLTETEQLPCFVEALSPVAQDMPEQDSSQPASSQLPVEMDLTVAVSSSPDEIVIWECSAAARTFNNRGWSRSDDEWIRRTDASLRKPNANLLRCAEDPKFRTRLCNHWDVSLGTYCPMRKKNKCVFAHGPVELRVKEAKRNRWGRLVDKNGDNKNDRHSGGEDSYGAARSIETERREEGKWKVDGNNKSKKNTPRKKDSALSSVAEVSPPIAS